LNDIEEGVTFMTCIWDVKEWLKGSYGLVDRFPPCIVQVKLLKLQMYDVVKFQKCIGMA